MTKSLKIGVLTDVHLAPPGSPAREWFNAYPFDRAETMLAAALTLFTERSVDAVAVLGDLAMFGDDASLDLGLSRSASTNLPVLFVPGNHDGEGWSQAVARNLSRREKPPWPSFELVTKIEVDEEPEVWRASGIDHLGEDPLVILSHFPIVNVEAHLADAGLKYAGDPEWDDSILGIHDCRRPVLVLSGHVHVRYEMTSGTVLQLGLAALIEPPHAAAVIEIREAVAGDLEVELEHFEVADYRVDVVPVISPSESTWRYQAGAWSRR